MSDDTITLDELLAQCHAAMSYMSVGNPHRRLIAQCAVALVDLASRVPKPITEEDTRRALVVSAERILASWPPDA